MNEWAVERGSDGRGRTVGRAAPPHIGDAARRALAVQRTAGNRATLSALRLGTPSRKVMRCVGTCRCGGSCGNADNDHEVLAEGWRRLSRAVAERAGAVVLARADTLTAPRFLNEPLLEDCFAGRARMGVGAVDTGTNQPVSKVQQALVDWAAAKGITLDLGTTGPSGNGVDGVYGSQTAAAVMLFKRIEQLGSEEFGDVGPGTMRRLNDLFAGVAPAPTPPPPPPTPLPPTPPPPANPDAVKIQQAKDDRDSQLRQVAHTLDQMAAAVLHESLSLPGEGPVQTIQQRFPREVCVVQFWLNASPSDPDYWETLMKARATVERDRTASQPLISRTGPTCTATPAYAWSVVGAPARGTELCNQWFDSGRHCRSDVLIHETYHTLGAHNDGAQFPVDHTPAAAFDNADTLTQFGNDLIGLTVDNCIHTERSSTAATTVASCTAGLRTTS